MIVYLAARFSRKNEMLMVKEHLEERYPGLIEVNSRWLTGEHEWIGVPDHEIPPEENARFAAEDLRDIENADVFVCFTEGEGSGFSRGGRHVEAGYALSLGKDLLVVGPRENVFYCLPNFHHVDAEANGDGFIGRYIYDVERRLVAWMVS